MPGPAGPASRHRRSPGRTRSTSQGQSRCPSPARGIHLGFQRPASLGGEVGGAGLPVRGYGGKIQPSRHEGRKAGHRLQGFKEQFERTFWVCNWKSAHGKVRELPPERAVHQSTSRRRERCGRQTFMSLVPFTFTRKGGGRGGQHTPAAYLPT
eukprot:351538-Chlamydomonas_euryale.AAC.3